ncbi:MAG: hypothetical protein WC877_01165 [Dehalococcoidales bacterium]|jgi:hypothetical protein
MNNLSSDDVYHMFNYDTLYKSESPRRMKEIWNKSVPSGNQYDVDTHVRNVTYAHERINSGKPFRCDFHTSETVDFMAFCNEMHINCDNGCSGNEFHNKTYYKKFELVSNLRPGIIDKLFGYNLPISQSYLPRKIKYFIIQGDNKEEHYEYLGLTPAQIKKVEQFKRAWNIK